MYCQFENRYTMTEEMIQEYVRQIVCAGFLKGCAVLCALCALICGTLIYFSCYNTAAWFGILTILCFAAGLSAQFFTARQMFRLGQSRSGADETVVQFGDRILVQDCGAEIWFDYSEITAVKILNSFSVLLVGKRKAIIFTPTGFSKGERFTLWRFFRGKRPDLWAKTTVCFIEVYRENRTQRLTGRHAFLHKNHPRKGLSFYCFLLSIGVQ